jgi:predicted signal transduction protein with EAL and GGDEF domain
VSIGVATFPDDGACGESLFRVADAATYAAKDLGRDRVVAFSAAVGGEARSRSDAEAPKT